MGAAMTGVSVIRPHDALSAWPAATPILLVDDSAGVGPAGFAEAGIDERLRQAVDMILSKPVRSRVEERSRRHCLAACLCRRQPVLFVETGDFESWRQAWRERREPEPA
jgi:hypothetical protein